MEKKLNVKNDCRGLWPQDIINIVLESRGIKDAEEFLNPSLEKYLLPLEDLKNIDKAVDIILNAMERGDRVGVYADV